MGNLVEVEDLRVSFFTKGGEVRAVAGISYAIEKGKVLGVVGESGCGKSVTSWAMMGLLPHPGQVVGGRIVFDGVDMSGFAERDFARYRGKRMAMIFQEPMSALNPVLSVGEQIREQMIEHLNLSAHEAWQAAVDLLDKVGIPSPGQRASEYPHQLSGGMKQRVMIAMAISCRPRFLIADEPTTALDVTIQAQILELIQRLQEEMKMTVQFITHDLGVISEISDTIHVMYLGKIMESGSREDIFQRCRHPYTKGLLASVVRFGRRVEKLHTIAGSVPGTFLGRGCVFQNRCPNASVKCSEEEPREEREGATHRVWCHHPLE